MNTFDGKLRFYFQYSNPMMIDLGIIEKYANSSRYSPNCGIAWFLWTSKRVSEKIDLERFVEFVSMNDHASVSIFLSIKININCSVAYYLYEEMLLFFMKFSLQTHLRILFHFHHRFWMIRGKKIFRQRNGIDYLLIKNLFNTISLWIIYFNI